MSNEDIKKFCNTKFKLKEHHISSENIFKLIRDEINDKYKPPYTICKHCNAKIKSKEEIKYHVSHEHIKSAKNDLTLNPDPKYILELIQYYKDENDIKLYKSTYTFYKKFYH